MYKKFCRFVLCLGFLFSVNAYANPILWQGGEDLTAGENWVGNAVPTDQAALFDATAMNFNPKLISSSENPATLSLSEIILAPDTAAYCFTVGNGGILSVNGQGITNQTPGKGSATFNFDEKSTLNIGQGSATTTDSLGVITYNFNDSTLNFAGDSPGQTSIVNLQNNSSLDMLGTKSVVLIGQLNADETSTVKLGKESGLYIGDGSVISGTITDSSSPGGTVVIFGNATFNNKEANTYSGGTAITGGNLSISNDDNLGKGILLFQDTGTLIFDIQIDQEQPAKTNTLNSNRNIGIFPGQTANIHVANVGTTAKLHGGIASTEEQADSTVKLAKTGPGTLVLTNPNGFSGLTQVDEGTLMAASNSIRGDIVNHATLNFVANSPWVYEHTLKGNGSFIIEGLSPVALTGNSSAYTGNTSVQGTLLLTGSLGGNIVIDKGTLAGNGIVEGNLRLNQEATIAPGDNAAIMTVKGNYVQASGSTYQVQFNGIGGGSLIAIDGKAHLEGGVVIVTNPSKTYDISKTTRILTANGGVEGKFEGSSATAAADQIAMYTPVLSYDDNNVFFNITPAFSNVAKTFNQKQVAKQLDSISNPTPSQLTLLNTMLGLNNAQARHALNQMSGQQHAADLFLTELVNRQFIRRLYNPLRPIVNTDPCYVEWYEKEKQCCCYPQGIDVWAEGGGSRTTQKGRSNAIGYKMDGAELTIGAQKTFCNQITAGVAASYEYDHIRYHVGGSGRMNSFLGGIYGLYRPACYYVLADLAYGYSTNKMERPVEIKTLKFSMRCKPKMSQLTFYGESGIDFKWEDLLIQPFLGVEIGSYWRHGVTEHGAHDLDLSISKRHRTEVNTRLGAHLSVNNLPSDFDLSLDLAYNYRWKQHNNEIKGHFATFGTEFTIQGVPLFHSSFECNLALSKEICSNWRAFAEFSGDFWKRSCSYYVLGGIEYGW